MTEEEFIEQYIARAKEVDPTFTIRRIENRGAVFCDCGEAICFGWRMEPADLLNSHKEIWEEESQ